LFRFRRRRRSRSLVYVALLALGLSVWQYQRDGALTWPGEVFRELRDYAQSTFPSFQLPDLSAPAPEQVPTSDTEQRVELAGRVVSVADGDTFTLRLTNGDEVRVRLFGIDAPEQGQAFGRVSGNALKDAVLNKNVQVVQRDVDQYGRLVGTLYHDGRNINLEQVQAGLAWWYRNFAPDDRELEQAEAAAKRERRGLWRDTNPVPPWDWRRQQR